MDTPIIFLLVLKSFLFSTGGYGPLPSLHADLLLRNWATDKQFADALAVGQLSPGPSGLWVVSLAYLVGGVPGALAASTALLLPPLLVLFIQSGHARIADHPATHGLLDGIVLVIAGSSVTILVTLLNSNGLDAATLAIVALSAALAITRRLPVFVILLFAALAGLLLYWR